MLRLNLSLMGRSSVYSTHSWSRWHRSGRLQGSLFLSLGIIPSSATGRIPLPRGQRLPSPIQNPIPFCLSSRRFRFRIGKWSLGVLIWHLQLRCSHPPQGDWNICLVVKKAWEKKWKAFFSIFYSIWGTRTSFEISIKGEVKATRSFNRERTNLG